MRHPILNWATILRGLTLGIVQGSGSGRMHIAEVLRA